MASNNKETNTNTTHDKNVSEFSARLLCTAEIFSFKNRMNCQIHPSARKPHMLLCTGKNKTNKKVEDAEKKELLEKEPPQKYIYIYVNNTSPLR